MIIGIPRERKTLERRIALTPDGARELVQHGHKVLIETKAGIGSGFQDDDFRAVGANIVSALKEVWSANMVVKVKEPDPEEYQYFRKDLVLFDYLHLASMPELSKAMVEGALSGVAYELVQTDDRRLPLLEPMSEVAGKLSILNGSYFLLAQNGGQGLLLGGTLGVAPGTVVIIGAGIAGRCACEMALGTGARVTVMDIDSKKLEQVKLQFGSTPTTLYSTKASLEREIASADLLIGAVLVPGAAAPKIVTREMIRRMKRGAVFVDISIDQGGCSETMHPTSLDQPVYDEEGVIHYGVCNMPAQTPRTSTFALTAATLPYITKLADLGFKEAMSRVKELRVALNVHQGKLTNKPVSDAVGIPFTPIEEALR